MKPKKFIDLVIPIITGTLLVVITSVIFLQIMLRNFLDISLPWSDEVAKFSMSWMILSGTIWLTKNNQHLNTGLKLHHKLNKRLVCFIDSILELIFAIIAALVAYQSAMFAFESMNIESMALPWLKMGYVFIALPLAMSSIFYYYLKSFIKNIVSLLKKDYGIKGM
jgi:TRAP-type C4-dicarboxylate transport system permease small subunit